mgnify:FL=1
MHDFSCTSAEEMNYPVLAERVRYFKEDVKGATAMCREVEKLVMEEKRQSLMEGREEGMLSAIRAVMEELSVSLDDAMRILKISEAEKDTYRRLLNR